jgi:TPR repeat protein
MKVRQLSGLRTRRHSLAIVKKTVTDGLLEIEHRIGGENEREQNMLEEKRRAELGDLDAQRFLGMISKDKVEAAKWLRRATEQGDRPSMYDLGRLFVNGDGIEKDIAEGYFGSFLAPPLIVSNQQKWTRANERRVPSTSTHRHELD